MTEGHLRVHSFLVVVSVAKGGSMNLIRREPNVPLFTRFETPFYREMEEMSDRLGKLFGTWTRPFEI
jgi:hypothetical protein